MTEFSIELAGSALGGMVQDGTLSAPSERLPLNYPPLRALLSALSEEVSALSGSYCTRLTEEYQAGGGILRVETTYGFPESGVLYIGGFKFLYEAISQNRFIGLTHQEGFEVLDRGEVVSSIDPVTRRGAITRAAKQMQVQTATGSMLDVIGMNHAVPRYFGIDDEQYRRLIQVLAYMAGKGTQNSIENFLDAVLDHKTICGEGLVTRSGGEFILTSNNAIPPFGSLLSTMFTRVELALVRPNDDIVLKTFKMKSLAAPDAPDSEFYNQMLLESKISREFSSADELDLFLDEHGADQMFCAWRIILYRVWEDPYKRIEREQAVGVSPIAPPIHERQSVGNTVLVDLHMPQENSSIGAGYVSGQLILTTEAAGGLQADADGRIREEDGELRLYLEGDCVGFTIEGGLQRYLKTYPRQVLSVRRVAKSGSLASERVSVHQRDVFYIPVGATSAVRLITG